MRRCQFIALAILMLSTGSLATAAGEAPSDAPELGGSGAHAVGFRELALTTSPQALPGGATGERVLPLAVWYPARATAVAQTVCYKFSPPPIPDQAAALADTITECGAALANAPPVSVRHPVVLISHGYGGWATGFSWLAENLASKGYVVISIDHHDLVADAPEQQAASFALTVMTRSADQRYLIDALTTRRMPRWLNDLVDAERIALVGYSMGGFGALATAGATYDRSGGLATALQGNIPDTGTAPAALKALVLFAPWGGLNHCVPGRRKAWPVLQCRHWCWLEGRTTSPPIRAESIGSSMPWTDRSD